MKNSRMSLINPPHDTDRAFSPARSRTDLGSIRGRISGPIPIPSPLDEDFPMRNKHPEDVAPTSAYLSQEPGTPSRGENRNHTPPQSIHVRSRSSPIGPTVLRSANGQKRDTPATLRQSAFSIGTSGSKTSPQRKKSILRGAIGRLFGRKKNSTSQAAQQSDESSRPTPESWTQQHRSTVLVTPIAENPSVEQRRSTPFTQDDYGRALRSHTVDEKDRTAIERSRTLAQTDSNFSRRRLGGSSGVSIRERRAMTGELGGLSPRPASVHARISTQEFASNPEEIGRAITSDYSGLKRRSRSLSAIIAPGNLECRRSRSGDIRYWRQSYDPGFKSPVASSYQPETEENAIEGLETPQEQDSKPVPPSPLQPFSFGDMASMNQMAGMKITQAATIESRLGRFEERMTQLEKRFSGVSNVTSDCHPLSSGHELRIGAKATPPVSYIPSPASSKFHLHQDTNATAHQLSPGFANHRPDGSNRLLETQSPALSNDRPLSISTIRAATSLPSLTQDLTRPLTGEHYTTLMALLETERSARQALEAQVKTLGHQISILSKATNSLNSSRRVSRQKSAFDYDYDDEAEDETGPSQAKAEQDRFLVSQDSSMNTHEREEEDDSTSYATSADGDGEVYSESPTFAKTVRTLSLSQLTYNTSAPKAGGEPMPNVI